MIFRAVLSFFFFFLMVSLIGVCAVQCTIWPVVHVRSILQACRYLIAFIVTRFFYEFDLHCSLL